MIGEVQVVDDVPLAFAQYMATAIAAKPEGPFVLACSGGSSGTKCFEAFAADDSIPWGRLSLVFVDERCVDWNSPDANGTSVAAALGKRMASLRSYARMSCDAGPEAYEAVLRALGTIDLVQLGLGPDGHTASIFPESEEFLQPAGGTVVRTVDPSGRNSHPRLSLTFAAIAAASARVVTVIGAEKHDAFAAIQAGEDLPGLHVDLPGTTWIVERSTIEGR